jgi:transposase
VDESAWGGKPRQKMNLSQAAKFREAKPTMVGMIERGGKVRLRIVPSRRGPALSREVRANVDPSSIIFTDDWRAYKSLGREYLAHSVISAYPVHSIRPTA